MSQLQWDNAVAYIVYATRRLLRKEVWVNYMYFNEIRNKFI